MPGNDRAHFDEYRVQTLVKHTILEGYLPAYFRAFGTRTRLGYFDAFAGRGSYTTEDGREAPGSPLRALDLIDANPQLHSRLITVFAELDPVHHAQLEAKIGSHQVVPKLAFKPVVLCGAFTEVVQAMKAAVTNQMIPVFLFVDPCGAKGVDFESMKWILEQPGSELFLFFNSSAIRRVIGAVNFPGNRTILDAYLGTGERVDHLIDVLSRSHAPTDREVALLQAMCDALRTVRDVKYVLPFRVEHEQRQDTSHYFVHACKHPLGFRLMKRIMRDYLRRRGLTHGELELRQATDADDTSLFAGMSIRQDIEKQLEAGAKQVQWFKDVRTSDPDNLWSEEDYRSALLDLEEKRVIKVGVFDASGVFTEIDAGARPRRKGASTLGDNYWIVPSPK